MSFRDRLLSASYADVPFFVDTVSSDLGRRINVVRLAGADGAVSQDLGAEPKKFDIDAYLVGDDYDRDRDALEKALMTRGPARLVLPTRGAFSVRVTRGPFTTEMRGKQRYAIVRFSVVVDEGVRLKVRATDKGANLTAKASALKSAALADFDASYQPSSISRYLAAPTNAIGLVSQQLGKAQRLVATVTNPVSDFSAAIDNLANQASTLAQSPTALASALAGTVEGVISLALAPTTAVSSVLAVPSVLATPFQKSRPVSTVNQAMRFFMALGEDAPDPDGIAVPLESESRANTRAIYRLTRATALGAHADVIVGTPFDSATLALATLRQVSEEIDALQAYSASDELYSALADYRAALVDYLVLTSANLPDTVTIQQRVPVPALVLAHQRYGDATREAEVIERNRLAKPLEVVGDIGVLTS